MHEMSLALNIVDLATSKAQAAGAQAISQIEIEVGALAGVLVDSLQFCFEAAVRDTMAAGATLQIKEIAGRGHCVACDRFSSMTELIEPCPQCGGFLQVTEGRELRVVSIIVDE